MDESDTNEAPLINDEGARRIERPSGSTKQGEIPIEIQDKFKEWASTRTKANAYSQYEIDPTRLFYVGESDYKDASAAILGSATAQRVYHHYDGNNNFSTTAYAFFNKMNGLWIPHDVLRFSESHKERQSLTFFTLKKNPWSVSLETSKTGIPNPPPMMRFIKMFFDHEGNLIKVHQPSDRGWSHWEIDPQELITRARTRVNQISQSAANEMLGFQYKHGDAFIEATFNTNDDESFVTRVIKIPLKIDPTRVKEQLFPPEIFSDPFNVDPEDDSSRLNADLEKAVGIEDILIPPKIRS